MFGPAKPLSSVARRDWERWHRLGFWVYVPVWTVIVTVAATALNLVIEGILPETPAMTAFHLRSLLSSGLTLGLLLSVALWIDFERRYKVTAE